MLNQKNGEQTQNGWFIMVPNPIKNGMIWGVFPPHIFGKHPDGSVFTIPPTFQPSFSDGIPSSVFAEAHGIGSSTSMERIHVESLCSWEFFQKKQGDGAIRGGTGMPIRMGMPTNILLKIILDTACRVNHRPYWSILNL